MTLHLDLKELETKISSQSEQKARVFRNEHS